MGVVLEGCLLHNAQLSATNKAPGIENGDSESRWLSSTTMQCNPKTNCQQFQFVTLGVAWPKQTALGNSAFKS